MTAGFVVVVERRVAEFDEWRVEKVIGPMSDVHAGLMVQGINRASSPDTRRARAYGIERPCSFTHAFDASRCIK